MIAVFLIAACLFVAGDSKPSIDSNRSSYLGDPVAIPNNGMRSLTWDTLGSGQELLDRTNREWPTVKVAGRYAVTAIVAFEDEAIAVGRFHATLHLDQLHEDAVSEETKSEPTVDGRIVVSLTVTYFVPAGGVISVDVRNFDGALARTFLLREALIQRLR